METTQPPPAPVSSADVRTWNVLCHASALLGFFFPWAGHILAPLIVWLVKRGDSAEIDAHGKESINFQLTMLIYSVISGILCLVLIGFVLLAILPDDPFSELKIALSQLRESTSALPLGDAYLAVNFRSFGALQHWIGVLSLLLGGAAGLEDRNCQK